MKKKQGERSGVNRRASEAVFHSESLPHFAFLLLNDELTMQANNLLRSQIGHPEEKYKGYRAKQMMLP